MPRMSAGASAAKMDDAAENKIKKSSEKKVPQKKSKPKEQQSDQTESTTEPMMVEPAEVIVWNCEECQE